MGVVETIQQRIQKLGWKQGQVFDGALKRCAGKLCY